MEIMSNFKEDIPDFVGVKVKSEFYLDNTFLPQNEHPVGDHIDPIVDGYSLIKVKTEYEDIDNHELNTNSLKQTNSSYINFNCKEEIKKEAQSEISDNIEPEKQPKLEEFLENSEADEKIDISEFILQSSECKDNEFKIESENDEETQKAFTNRQSPDDDSLEQRKEDKLRNNCQFCIKSFAEKKYLFDHILKQHKPEIKGDLKSIITTKIHSCSICNSYETTIKVSFDRHVNSFHNDARIKMKCQFCTESFISKQSLDGHMLKKHKDNIKNDIKTFITSKVYACKMCNSFETTYKTSLDQHINSLHSEVKTKRKCQFCTESFMCKKSLDGHVLRKHIDKIKHNIKNFITNKVYVCKMCDSFETTIKSSLNRHVNSLHHEVKIKMTCQFCTESFMSKTTLDGHLLKKHKDKIQTNIKSFITSKIHQCKMCNAFETTIKSNLHHHINSVHNKEKNKLKCQFCAETYVLQKSLDGHVLKKHKDKIKGDIKSVITSKIHSCKMCSYETTVKYVLDKHVSSMHNKKKKLKSEIAPPIIPIEIKTEKSPDETT